MIKQVGNTQINPLHRLTCTAEKSNWNLRYPTELKSRDAVIALCVVVEVRLWLQYL